tara:strand:- start:705 stop:1415 length:711 start_codon:yes stop_codon:yes gene_type:complete
MVCEPLHEERTKPLYNTVIRRIKDCGDNYYLLGGFEAIDELPIIKVSDLDDYHSCVEKIESIFKEDWCDADWHIICDDDTFIHTENLNSFISRLPEDNLRVYCSQLSEDSVGIFGGAGILMNNKTFKLIQKFVIENGWKEDRSFQSHSDIALSRMCCRLNRKLKAANKENDKIYIVNPKTMYSFNPHTMKKNQKSINVKEDLITVHIKDMRYIWDGFNEQGCPYQSLENAFCRSQK